MSLSCGMACYAAIDNIETMPLRFPDRKVRAVDKSYRAKRCL